MKKIYLLAIAFATAGITQANIVYTDIADATLTPGGSIDINFDGTGPVEFTIDDGGFMAVEPSIFFNADAHFITVSAAEWDVIKGLNLNDAISANSSWEDQGDAYIDPFWGTTTFPSGTDAYIGASFKLGSNVHYGWIRVNWDGNGTLIVKDFAYDNTPNTAISAGDVGTTSIKDKNVNSLITLYPNPTTDYINIRSNSEEVESASIISMTGKLISTHAINKNATINVMDLKQGNYIIKLTSNKESINKVFSKK